MPSLQKCRGLTSPCPLENFCWLTLRVYSLSPLPHPALDIKYRTQMLTSWGHLFDGFNLSIGVSFRYSYPWRLPLNQTCWSLMKQVLYTRLLHSLLRQSLGYLWGSLAIDIVKGWYLPGVITSRSIDVASSWQATSDLMNSIQAFFNSLNLCISHRRLIGLSWILCHEILR